MAQTQELLEEILKIMEPVLKETGFTMPAGLAVQESAGKHTVVLGGAQALKIEMFDGKVALCSAGDKPEVAKDGDYSRLSLCLLDPETADNRDVRYVAEEFNDTLRENFGKKAQKQTGKKRPQTVSKSAVKNGEAYYDCNAFANRLTGMYPELRQAYLENYEKNPSFLAEDFFQNHANEVIFNTIRQNDPQRMRRLFNILNEVYDNGVNDAQSLIAVTVLGALGNDQQMLANCIDYMSPDLCGVVLQVNKLLASGGGKSARMRLENPPAYKPKKKKKASFMERMTGGNQPLQ